jgi:hypothetical protein
MHFHEDPFVSGAALRLYTWGLAASSARFFEELREDYGLKE